MFKFLQWLSNNFIRVFQKFIAIALPSVKQIILAQLKDFAITAVSKVENTDLSNNERRNQAFNEIKQSAVNAGIQAGASLIFLAIELALQYIKEEKK